MAGSIDGKDYVMFVFVLKSELQSYKRRWPNQVLVEMPFEGEHDNWKDLARQTIKIFGETLGVDYVFMIDDNIYCGFKSNEGKWEPVSMLEYFQSLQEGATQSESPLVGSRVTSLGNLNVPFKQGEWENGVVHSCYAVKTRGFDVYFPNLTSESNEDQGLTAFNRSCNEVGVVQQNQKYLLQCGYSMEDPITEGIEYRQPEYNNVSDLEPEMGGFNLKVRLVSLDKIVDQPLSDGSRYARGIGIIADPTGAIIFTAKNEQVDLVPGKSYAFRNAKVAMFKGWMRIEVGEWGKIESITEDITPKTTTNLSKTEYELVDKQKHHQDEDKE